MSSPFAFDEDSDEADSVGKNIPMPPDSSSEDSESSSVSSKSAGSDEYNFDSNAFSSRIKRMKRQKDRLQDIKKQKTDLDNDVLPKRNEFNEFDDDFDDDADENAAAVAAISAYHSTRPAFCSRNLSQDSNVKPSQSYLSLDTLRVNKMATNDSVEDNQYQVSVEEDALSHTDDSLRRKREQLNKKIQAEPQNVDLWLEFIKFQDVQCSYEKLNSSGSSSSSRSLERVYADKKMSILDKALKINPGSEQLCNTRYKIMIKTQPTDRVLQELKVLLGKQRSNMYLHRQYLRLMQHNMNRNTVEALCEEYHHAIQMSERKQALSTLLEFGTFLKQAGLWEILLSVLQQYLEENLKTKNFDMGQVFELKDASEEEEQKFLDDELAWVSKLDTMELSSWVRVEQERSDAHFMPVNTILTCIDDTDRYCLPDDVLKFVRPVPSPEYLLSISLQLLKVPPLPLTHSAWVLCSLGYSDNTGDDAELLMTGHFTTLSHSDTRNCSCYISQLPDLISSPSYLAAGTVASHEKYLALILSWWQTAIPLLDECQQVPMYVWLFRFLRSLFLLPGNRIKSLYDRCKGIIKDVLKQDRLRNAVPLYVELAYFERDYGKIEDGIKVLQKLFDSSTVDSQPPSASLLSAARSMAVLMMHSHDKTETLSKYKEILCKLFRLDSSTSSTNPAAPSNSTSDPSPPSLLNTIQSGINNETSRFNPREEPYWRSLYESHSLTELILAESWLLYLGLRIDSESESRLPESEGVYKYLTSAVERFEVCETLDYGFLVKETLAEQLCVFLAAEIHSSKASASISSDSLRLKLKHNLSKFITLFPNNAALCHLASQYACTALASPHILPCVIHAVTVHQPVDKQGEHSELVAKVNLLLHKKWDCSCNLLSSVDRCPSSKQVYMEAIESFSLEGNEKQAMDLHTVLIEKRLRVHIPVEMVRVLCGSGNITNNHAITNTNDKEQNDSSKTNNTNDKEQNDSSKTNNTNDKEQNDSSKTNNTNDKDSSKTNNTNVEEQIDSSKTTNTNDKDSSKTRHVKATSVELKPL